MQKFLRSPPVNNDVEICIHRLIKHTFIYRLEFQVYEIRCIDIFKLLVTLF